MSNITSLIQSLLHDLKTPDLAPYRKRVQELVDKHSPRKKFERWRNSEEGKLWKNQEFEQIQGRCAGCQQSFPSPAYLVIDHILPIVSHPELAVEAKNFQLLCHACNLKKGATTPTTNTP